MQRSRPTILLLALVLALAVAVSAASKGSETKGKHYFKQTCKTCHTKGAVGGEITPLNKKMTQWTAYFQAGKHAHGKEPLAQYLSEEQLRDVQAFLTNHAADSLQPETCGKD
jgi:mono/diheme cytochrome c family protein